MLLENDEFRTSQSLEQYINHLRGSGPVVLEVDKLPVTTHSTAPIVDPRLTSSMHSPSSNVSRSTAPVKHSGNLNGSFVGQNFEFTTNFEDLHLSGLDDLDSAEPSVRSRSSKTTSIVGNKDGSVLIRVNTSPTASPKADTASPAPSYDTMRRGSNLATDTTSTVSNPPTSVKGSLSDDSAVVIHVDNTNGPRSTPPPERQTEHLPAIFIPDPPAFTVPDSPAVTVPDSPAVFVPDSPSFTVPDSPAVTVPDSPAVFVPDSPAVIVPDKIEPRQSGTAHIMPGYTPEDDSVLFVKTHTYL